MKKKQGESWNGIQTLRTLYPQLSEEQVTKLNGDITAYIAKNDRNKKQDINVISDILSQHLTIDTKLSEHIKKCQYLVDGYTQNSNRWEFGENLWAPFLYIFSVVSLLTDAISFLYPECAYIATLALVFGLICIGVIWYVLDKFVKRILFQQSTVKVNDSRTHTFVEKLKLFGFVSARYAGSISFMVYCGYYGWKVIMMSNKFPTEVQSVTLIMYGIFALGIISKLIYQRYKTYWEIQKKYLHG